MKSCNLTIPKRNKDGEVWDETIPFNPLHEDWAFIKACCCEAKFVRGDVTMVVAKKKDRVRFVQNGITFLTAKLPQSQLEFLAIHNGINPAN